MMSKLILDPRVYLDRAPARIPNSPVLGAIVVAVLVIGAIGTTVYFSLTATSEAQEVQSTIESFLELTSSRDFAAAYEFLSVFHQKAVSEGAFTAALSSDAAYAEIAALKRTDIKRVPTGPNAAVEYRYEGHITYSGGSAAELTATLVSQDNTWKIDAIEIRR